MIQCSTDYFPSNHRDYIFTVTKFNLTDIGECEIQVFPYQDDTNPPTVFIVNEHGLICGIRLDKSEFWGREYVFTQEQKDDINKIINSDMTCYNKINQHIAVWGLIKMMWSGLNDRLEKISLPDIPPDYTKLP